MALGPVVAITAAFTILAWTVPIAAQPYPADDPPADTEPPMEVTGFSVLSMDEEIYLEWTNPSDSDFAGTIIRFSDVDFPSAPGLVTNTGKTGVLCSIK